MKYVNLNYTIPAGKRKELNEKVLYLIDSSPPDSHQILPEDIFNAYTGDGGLHGLEMDNYGNYHEYSSAKKEIENGQFFTPPRLCEFIISCLKLSETDLVADLTCGMGNFFNYVTESNAYGCETDIKAFKVAHYLYPEANLEMTDIRTYKPGLRFDYVVGNPPFNLKWWVDEDTEMISQLYYCIKAAELLKPFGILAVIVPQSFLADDFSDGRQIKEMEKRFSFLGQIILPSNAFSNMGAKDFPTKLQFWQKKSEIEGWTPRRYQTDCKDVLSSDFDIQKSAQYVYEKMLVLAKSNLEQNRSRIFLELARNRTTSDGFEYQTRKLLYQIKVHPQTKSGYAKCCEYLHRFYTETMPANMDFNEWKKVQLTEKKVLAILSRALNKQNKKPEKDVIALVKQGNQFVYKGYSAKARRQLTSQMRIPIPVYQLVVENTPESCPGFQRLIQKKRAEYDNQSLPFSEMSENPLISQWLNDFKLWDCENEEEILLNPIQKHDVNLILQKRYGMLQWEQGSGKTLAGIAAGVYRMQCQHIHSTWVVSSAISIRNNWDIVLSNYGLSYVFVEKLKDLDRIGSGDFVLITLNKVGQYKRQIRHWLKCHQQKVQLILDESDEIANPNSLRTKAVKSPIQTVCEPKRCFPVFAIAG